jgi:hypothetical protein
VPHLCVSWWALQLLHPQTTLQLCFLAVAVLREAITFYDIISWALDAQLPFLKLPDIACQCLSGMTLLRLVLITTNHAPAPTITCVWVVSCHLGLYLVTCLLPSAACAVLR